MILNYIKIAIRVFSRNKLISIINLLGLSIGIAAFAIIMFYVDYEFNFETFQANHERVYRVCVNKEFVGTPPPIAKVISNGFPEVESVTRIGRSSFAEKVTVKAKDVNYYENRFYFVDSTFFQTFDYQLLYGNPLKVLNEPFEVVLSEKNAKKYFNRTDVIGETIEYNGNPYVVSGVAKDVPLNSHFHFDLIAPFRGTMVDKNADLNKYWGSVNYFTYVRFKDNVSAEEFQVKLVRNVTEEYKEYVGENYFKGLYFQPIKQAHIEIIRGNLEAPVNKNYLLIYIFVAIIILVVASINYINLSITGSLRRAKEVGLRKVVGADRIKIRNQFLSESVFFTILSLALSFVFIESLIPMLNKWFGIQVSISYFDFKFLLLSLVIILWVGLIAGSYPSFVVSALQPIKVLKSGFRGSKANTSFRNILLVLQFVISICLVISAITINSQMRFIENLNVGFNRHGVINIPLHQRSIKANHELIEQAFISNSNVLNASANSYNITDRPFHQDVTYEKDGELLRDMAWFIFVDENFFKTYEIEFIRGNTFPNVTSENQFSNYIINKSAAIAYFGNENPIGKRLSMFGSKNMGRVVGVIDDFNFLSLHHPIEPLVFALDENGYKSAYDYVSLRINQAQSYNAIKDIENKWKELYPNYPLEIQYVDLEYDKLYKSEAQTGDLIMVFTFLSIFISCLGLFGINSLIAKYRIREISVRKVYGASISQILMVLSSNIFRLVLIANILAWPLAYYLMDNWLNNFEYRVQMHWYVFLAAGLLTLLISLLTVSTEALKTAKSNPAENLKFE